MKTPSLTPVLLLMAGLLGACGTVPTTSLLEQTRSDYRSAQSNPQIAMYAPLELKQADNAMAQANAAADDRKSSDDIDQLAYLAKQKIAVAVKHLNIKKWVYASAASLALVLRSIFVVKI